MVVKNKVKRGESRCKECGYHVRGRDHAEGMHHKKPNADLLSRIEK
jgi:hypothetical protein